MSGFVSVLKNRYIGIIWDNIRVILGFYRDNGKESGNHYKVPYPLGASEKFLSSSEL